MEPRVRANRLFGFRVVVAVVAALVISAGARSASAQDVRTPAARMVIPVAVQTVGPSADVAGERGAPSTLLSAAASDGTREPEADRRGLRVTLDTLRLAGPPASFAYAADRATQANATAAAQRGYRGRRRHGDRGVAGLVLGAIGGFAAGGAIGVAVAEHSCNCEDPALHGFVIGAPIGAVIGGFIGYAIAR